MQNIYNLCKNYNNFIYKNKSFSIILFIININYE